MEIYAQQICPLQVMKGEIAHYFSPHCSRFISRDAKVPSPPPGHKWKEVRHDNKVTWLVSWTENIQGSIKYIMLNPSSRIKVRGS